MNNLINIDITDFPFVIIRANKQLSTMNEISSYTNTMTNFYYNNQNKNLIVIYDLSMLRGIGSKGRKMIGEWLSENKNLINNAVVGVCYVSENILHQIILEGIFSFNKPIWKSKVVNSISEGMKWGNEILKNK